MLIAAATSVTLSPLHTLTLALLVFFVGVVLTRSWSLLRHYGIPEAVSGGLIAAVVAWICFTGFNIEVVFDLTIRDQLFLIFFATIGLNARLADAWSGGKKLLLLLLLTVGFILAQNGLALAGAHFFGLPHAVGVLLGSAALIGGHGSAIAWSTVVEQQTGFAAADELGIATATLGLVAGGILGSPIATLLIRRYYLAESSSLESQEHHLPLQADKVTAAPQSLVISSHLSDREWMAHDSSDSVSSVMVVESSSPQLSATDPFSSGATGNIADQGRDRPQPLPDKNHPLTPVTHMTLMYAMLMTLVAVVGGQWLHGAIATTGFTLPTFIPCLLVAMVMTNLVTMLFPALPWPTKTPALELIHDYSLSVFLAMSLMGMQLWSVVSLGGAFVVIFLVQMVMAIAFIFLVIFPTLGADYEAAVMSAGFAGYSLGATPTALANMTTITQKYRPAPQAFLILPLVSAVFVDVLNSVMIRFFVG
ncbi:MAG: sodium/glutamate symporter [Leptolyngbyaceae cyanobacterium]